MRRVKNCWKIEAKRAWYDARRATIKVLRYRRREWRRLMLRLFLLKCYCHRWYIAQTIGVVAASLAVGCLMMRCLYIYCLMMR